MTRPMPFTPPGPVWSQREYVACMELGIAFAAHRHGEVGQVFHYAFPGDIGCTSVLVSPLAGGTHTYIDHPFTRCSDWIDKAAAAVCFKVAT